LQDRSSHINAPRYALLIALAIDTLAVNLSFLFYYKFREAIPVMSFPEKVPMLIEPMLMFMLFWLGLFWLFGLYRFERFYLRYELVVTLFQATVVGILLLFTLIFADDVLIEQEVTQELPPRIRFGMFIYWLFLFGLCSLVRLVQATVVRRQLVYGVGRRNAVIIGTGKRAQTLAKDFQEHPALGVNVLGFLKEFSANGKPVSASPLLGSATELPTLLNSESISEVIIAADSDNHNDLLTLIGQCDGKGVSLKMLPDMFEIAAGTARTTQIYGTPLIELSPKLLSPLQENLKRLFDITVSLMVLLLGLPVWLILALVVWIDTKASPIYSQVRVGLHGKPFTIYKFRSMRADAESSGPKLTQKTDDRITPFGHILRKFRIDEFPQFFNVLIGDMSVVGPRPERPYFIEQITKQAPHYTRVHRVRPGITSWGQVKFGYAANVVEMVDRLDYDLFYIDNISLALDIKIILSTVYVVITGRGQ
jgi:exopolysaccharide biosynthesis polyprenyl glycosylphosphotransferase